MVLTLNILKVQKNKSIQELTPKFEGSPLNMVFVLRRRSKAKKPNSAKEKLQKLGLQMTFIDSYIPGFGHN